MSTEWVKDHGMIEADDRAGLQRALDAHPVHSVPPVGDPYVMGRWHKDRATPKGYVKEFLAACGGVVTRSTPSKLVVFARPRSGTTLLGHLLGQVPDVHDDRESLHHAVVAPVRFLENRARRCGKRAYVSKLLSYQMLEVQRIRDPLAFFERLTDAGFLLIHLRRRTYDQALSLSTAQATHQYVLEKVAPTPHRPSSLRIDPERFVAQVRWNAEMLSFEDALIRNFPHRVVQYERHLCDPDTQQQTTDAVCEDLAVAPAPVQATLRRTGGQGGKFRVENRRGALGRTRTGRPRRNGRGALLSLSPYLSRHSQRGFQLTANSPPRRVV